MRAIIFDCFGVIYASPLVVFLDAIDDISIRNRVLDYFHLYDRGAISKEELLIGLTHTTGKARSFIERELFSGFKINPTVVAYIKELRGTYKTGLLTNIGEGIYQKIEEDLTGLFDTVVPSFRIRIAKPDPEIYLLAARNLGLPAEACVFVDDQQKHCDGARNVGMKAILFKDLRQLQQELSRSDTN